MREVSFFVRDSKTKEPLPFANIAVYNHLNQFTGRGTITTANGMGGITVQQGEKIQITYIGYKTKQYTAFSNGLMTVEMIEDATLLDPVVVTPTQPNNPPSQPPNSNTAKDESFAKKNWWALALPLLFFVFPKTPQP